MLTLNEKASILTQIGIQVPVLPTSCMTSQEQHFPHRVGHSLQDSEADTENIQSLTRWRHEIDILYVIYTASRAAKGLRQAEQARQMAVLRHANEQCFAGSSSYDEDDDH
jgi:hypothetical protein